ncbi:carbohydrate ABC transporter substrate-binding protein, CUT1 family (TC 3.A.1.1.-) [Gracilibacillus orientalis]|uniref:Carbohydrate ABC transporter substrate-binding protein, CUT1 family (TC 3.A.1.1.-) n=1 Tax=Gracilibacillus orientalis TaxID=334253 RepID=A0A1I4HTY6_9BACI|nr:extracellular solute-binding protein [Gracilibacillus orientalis]SFL45592.1 carbohydrate ABC transporter substrate-binding protein, CUT1 family (TC 3.A.1.1.-) [Gracilibacillus orientalis]
MRKLIMLLLVSFIFLFIIACSDDSTSKEEQNNSDGNESNNSDEPFELSIMLNLHTPEVPQDKLEKLLEEKTNTALEIQWIPDGNYEERVNTAFSTNSLPHAVLVKTEQFTQFKDAIRDEQFWEIGPYLEEFENLSKLRESTLENSKVDNKLYSLYMGRPLSRSGLIYRKDWADNLGIDTPTTTNEFYDMLRAFTEDDPDGNGEDDTIGLTDRGNLGTFVTVSSWLGGPNKWGEQDGQLLPEFMFPEYKETLDFFRDLHSNGYMNKDAPVTSKTDQQEMMKNGTAGAYIGSMQDVHGIYQDAKVINPDVEFDVHNYIEGPDGEFGVRAIPGYGSLILFPKSSIKSEDELKSVLQFFDYLMSEEGANLLIWGQEGVHYEVVDDQAKVIDQNKFDIEIKPYTPFEIGEPLTNGRYESYFDYEPATKANKLYKDNDNYVVNDLTIGLDSETYNQNAASLQQIIEDATYQYILGEIDEKGFDEAIEKWKEAGGNDVIKEYNE